MRREDVMREAALVVAAEMERLAAALRAGAAYVSEVETTSHYDREWTSPTKSVYHHYGTTMHVHVQVVGVGESRCGKCRGVIAQGEDVEINREGPFHPRCLSPR